MKQLAMWTIVLAFTACGGGKDRKAKDDQARASAKPAERDVASAQKVLASIHVPPPWQETLSDEKTRSFMRDDVSLAIYLIDADAHPVPDDQPPTSLDALVEQTKPDKFVDGWPFFDYRFASVTDKGAAGDAIWVRGPLQSNDACGDHGCDSSRWQDNPSAGFVVYRAKGDTRYRCSARAVIGKDNKALDEAFALCKTGAWVP